MGERSNVIMKSGDEQVVFYSHWDDAESFTEKLKAGLRAGKGARRLDDYQYLNRIVFRSIVDGDDGDTGFGISQNVYDSGHPTIVVNVDEQTVKIGGAKEISISDFIQ